MRLVELRTSARSLTATALHFAGVRKIKLPNSHLFVASMVNVRPMDSFPNSREINAVCTLQILKGIACRDYLAT